MEELLRHKRDSEYQTYKCHARWSWNPSYTLCGRRIVGQNVAEPTEKVDCYGCLNAIERIKAATGYKTEEILQAISRK